MMEFEIWRELPALAVGGFVRRADGVTIKAKAVLADDSATSDSDIAIAVSAALGTAMRVIGSAWYQAEGPLTSEPDGVYVVSLTPVIHDGGRASDNA